MKINRLINQGASGGVSQLDAELVLAFVLDVGREYLIAHSEEEVGESDEVLFFVYLKMVGEGMPLAYIFHEKEFFGLNFYVDERVLIPRPETEMLVEKVIEFVGDGEEVRILDVGTGSGAIAIALGDYYFQKGGLDEVIALDVSEGAVEVARTNVRQHGLEGYVNVFESDLLEVLEDGEVFEVITANLPYIGEEKNRYVSVSAEIFEPHLALFGGADGLDLYRRLFQELFEKGVRAGMIVGEFGFAQGEDLAALLDQYYLGKWEIEKDLAGIDRMFVIKP